MSLTIQEDVKAHYMGIFYAIYASAGIVGGLISAFLFAVVAPKYVVGMLAAISLCGIFPLLLLSPVNFVHKESEADSARPKPWLMLPLYFHTGIYIAVLYGVIPFYLSQTI